MKSSTTRHSVTSPKYTQFLSFWKYASSARLLTSTSSKTALQHRGKAPVRDVRSRDSTLAANTRQRPTIPASKPISTTVTSPALSPRGNPGPVHSNGSVLKKYTKELFRRYDDRTSELTQEVRNKGELQRRIEDLLQRVKTLELENAQKDELIAELQETKAARHADTERLQTHMDTLRSKLARFIAVRKL